MKKILIAEDEQAIREFIVINLNRAGYQTMEAGNGQEALDLYAQENGDFDVAILDIMMPGEKDGFAVLFTFFVRQMEQKPNHSDNYSACQNDNGYLKQEPSVHPHNCDKTCNHGNYNNQCCHTHGNYNNQCCHIHGNCNN